MVKADNPDPIISTGVSICCDICILIEPQEISDPAEIRTPDPLIKSQLLYRLSYGIIL